MQAILAMIVCGILAALPTWALAQDKGYLGVEFEDLRADEAEGLGSVARRGVRVVEAMRGGPAFHAGVSAGDIILSIEGQEVKDSLDAVDAISTRTPGTRLQLQVMRGAEERTLIATLGKRPTGPLLQQFPDGDENVDKSFSQLQFFMKTEAAEMLGLTAIRLGAKGELARLLRQQQHLRAQIAQVSKRLDRIREEGKGDAALSQEQLVLWRRHDEIDKRLALQSMRACPDRGRRAW